MKIVQKSPLKLSNILFVSAIEELGRGKSSFRC